MLGFVFKRLLQSILVIWAVYTGTFWLLMAAPGDPFDSQKNASPQIVRELQARYDLDKPLYYAYVKYAWNIVRHGDLGPTISYPDWNVAQVIRGTLPVSMALGSVALLLALWLGVIAGMIGARFQGSWTDFGLSIATLLGISLPNFVIGSALLMFFSLDLAWLPSGGWGTLRQLVLPAFTLALPFMAYIARLTRASVLDVRRLDFVRTARAKGAGEVRIQTRHILANASIPILTYLGPALAGILVGSFVVEKIFAIHGMGDLFVNACLDKDIPVVLGTTLVYTVPLVFLNLLADIACAWADPRIRLQ
jgi:oligopeptide transport system permease protein